MLRTKSILDEGKEEEVDIFSKDGIYLYEATLTFQPGAARNGCFYTLSKDEEGRRQIKRIKIENYGDMKEN